jgi:tetratricopeptide (TPR) repeat protein
MRQFRFHAILTVLLTGPLVAAAMPALAQSPPPPAQAQQIAEPSLTSPQDTVDTLIAALKKERNADKAKSIASQIVSDWNDSGSATVNVLMNWANEAADEKRTAAAFDFLDQVTLLEPDYAQAWYKRANVHFTDGDTAKAMSDLNQTLTREPRYFPALASLASILEAADRTELAMKAWEEYLRIYPADREAQKEMQQLSEKLAGSRS